MKTNPLRVLLALVFASAIVGAAYSAEIAAAQKPTAPPFQTIYTSNSPMYGRPQGGLAADSNGNLYGTTMGYPCSPSCGQIFKLAKPAVGKTAWTFQRLHIFTTADGFPYAPLVLHGSTIYGTTYNPNASGIVFSLTPSGTSWVYKVLHRFAANGSGGGPSTFTGVFIAPNGTIYGAAAGGSGQSMPCTGVIYKIDTQGVYSVLHGFTSSSTKAGCDPRGELIAGNDGAIYGTTFRGGVANRGTVFRLTPGGVYSVLYSFTDGIGPVERLVFGGTGILYGTASGGPNNATGIVWSLTPVTGQPWTFREIHTFPSGFDTYFNGIARDSDGNLYGTTGGGTGGLSAPGYLYRLSPPAYGTVWTYTVLHKFTGFADGNDPVSDSLIIGNVLYAPTLYGGQTTGTCNQGSLPEGCGTVFSYRLH